MRIEFLEPVKAGTMQFETGDVKTFTTPADIAKAKRWVAAGWAKDEAGKTGERIAGAQEVSPDNLTVERG